MRILIVGLLAVAGCTAAAPIEGPSAAFSAAVSGRVAGEVRTCVPRIGHSSLIAVDSRTLTIDSGNVLWVSRLPSACPGLRPLTTLIVEATGSDYCRGDLFRTIERGSSIPGPTCVLTDFTAYRKVR